MVLKIENVALNAAEKRELTCSSAYFCCPECNQCVPACKLHAGMHLAFLLPGMQPMNPHMLSYDTGHTNTVMQAACRSSVTVALDRISNISAAAAITHYSCSILSTILEILLTF